MWSGMVPGSLSILKGGRCGRCCCCSNYRRPLLALLPSATQQQHLLKYKANIIKVAPAASSSFSISTHLKCGGGATAAFSATALIRINTRRTLLGSGCCFCTAASSLSSTVVNSNDDDKGEAQVEDAEDEMTKIKETANTLDIRVGKILKAWRHPEADSLYVEEVDVGEPQPRIICSGLVKYVPLDHLQDINVVVLANLKPRNMRGVKSSGMLMAASDASHENVELLVPPEGSVPGQRIWFGSLNENESLPDAASPNQIQKKKIWELVQPHLRTDDSCIAALGMHTMRTTEGVVVCRSLKNAIIS
ncbi:hypothetical protein ACH5RR_032375 [Cinchona calisaya]|uniref:tRNA-binding domain-containing protein n=1 Tax=Cinchona calisaya TaxID=153742 RepID=A0ABD2YJ05_9GENT